MTSVKIIEQIQRVLQDPEGYTEPTIANLADEYGQACDRLNEILSDIVTYIDRGFYCEAYRLTEEEDVVQEYQTLQFNERETWREVCRMFHYELKGKVSDENSWKVQNLILMYEPHKDLFKLNRHLALADAPARDRLDVLYQLAAITAESGDFGNSDRIWRRSIEKLEERRNQEIERIVSSLNLKTVQLSEIQDLLDELDSPMRLSSPKRETVLKLQKAREFLFDQARIDELSELVDDFKEVYDSKNERQALDYLNEYRRFSERYSRKIDDYYNALTNSQRSALKKALEYAEKVETRDERAAKVTRLSNELTALMDRGADRAEVEVKLSALENAVAATGHATTPPAAERAVRYLNAQSLKKARRTTMVVALVVALIALVIAGVAASMTISSEKKKVAAFTEDLAAVLDKYDNGYVEEFETAKKKVERLSPKLREKDAVIAALDRYEKTEKAESARLAEFDRCVKALEAAHAEKKTDNAAYTALKALHKTDAETTRFTALAQEENSLRKNDTVKSDADFKAKLDDLSQRYKALDFDVLSPQEARRELNNIKRELNGLTNRGIDTGVNQLLASNLEALANTVEKALAAIENKGAVDSIATAIGDADVYRKEVERNATRYNAAVGETFETAIEDLAEVKGWNKFVNDNGADILGNMDAAKLKKVLDLLAENKETLSVVPEYAVVKARCDKLVEESNGSPFAQNAAKLLEDLSMFKTPTWTLYIEDGDWMYYYADHEYAEEDEDGSEVDVNYFVDRDLTKKKPITMTYIDGGTYGVSTQAKLYKLVSEKQSEADDASGLKALYLDALNLVVNAPKEEIDPGLRLALCKTLADDAIACNELGLSVSPADVKTLSSSLASYDLAKYDYYQAPTELSKKLEKLTSAWDKASAVFGRVVEALTLLETDSKIELAAYQWVGAIVKGDAGLEVKLGDPDANYDGELYISSSLGELERCGKIVEGKSVLEGVDDESTWFPVYLRVPYAAE